MRIHYIDALQGVCSMYPIHRILVAIKEPRARQFPALEKAAQLARALDANLCLFHGIPEPVYLDVLNGRSLPQLERQASAAHRQRLEALAKAQRRRGVKVTTTVESDYPTHEAIIRAAAHFEADLIVAECHRSAHVAPWLLHFTDWELLRNSAVPVLLVKNRRPYHRSKVLAAVDPTHSYAKPANLDDEILCYGSTIADALRGALHAVHAYNPLLVGMTPNELAAPNGIAKARAEGAAHARAALDPILDSIGMARTRRHIVDGFAIDVIESVASAIRAEIVVMGAISRSGLKRLFIGNTAERVLDRMTCDLLIVKPREFSNGIARVARGPRVIAGPLPPAA
jgi:universal stress protein E